MKDIDWGKIKITDKVMEYVMPKYENKNWMKDSKWSQIILNDIYSTFYKDEAEEDEETKVVKEKKYLSMVEFEKRKAKLNVSDELYMVEYKKGKAKLVVSNEMVEYALAKYGKNWNLEDEIADVILEDLRIKYGKDDKGKGKVDDLQNRVERLEGNLARAIKAKQTEHDKGKATQAENDIDYAKKAKETKEAELKVKKEVVEVSSDERFSGDNDVVLFNDVKYPLSDAEIRMFKERLTTSRAPTASTSTFKAFTRSKAHIASTSNAQDASTASRGYMKIAMIGCVLSLRDSDDLNAPPPSTTQKRKP
ncbi:hypothetical protein Tco_0091727 [Tanacetum coccineum]